MTRGFKFACFALHFVGFNKSAEEWIESGLKRHYIGVILSDDQQKFLKSVALITCKLTLRGRKK